MLFFNYLRTNLNEIKLEKTNVYPINNSIINVLNLIKIYFKLILK